MAIVKFIKEVFSKIKGGLRFRRVVRRCINRVKFLMLYRFMRSVSDDAKIPHYNFACGTIKGYKWRMFVDYVCWIGINDNTSDGSRWPAFYSKREVLEWIRNN